MTVQQTLERPAVDSDPIGHLDEEWTVACDWGFYGEARTCEKPAAWWVRCRTCGHTVAECAPHRVEEADLLRHCTHMKCHACRTQVASDRWRDLFDIVPIGGLP